MKKRIAIWMPGGVGGGYYSQGIPVISKLVDDLSVEYAISIYSLHAANAGFNPDGYLLFSVSKRIKMNWLRWLLLVFLFFKNHFIKKYHALYAFWGFPTGFIVTMISKVIGRPSVIHLQGGDAVYMSSINYGSLKGLMKNLMIWSYRHCSVLIALTHFQKDKLIEAGVSRPIDVIPFGADLNLFKRKEELNLHVPVRFLHVGNLLPVKDQITLLNSFAWIVKSVAAELRIIGEDHLHGFIQNRCKELNLQDRVMFMGIQPYDQMPEHYAWADVLLMTSMYEGQCLAVSEAAASGVLIAGTRVGILSDWGDRCAIVVEPGNARQLADEIISTIRNPEAMRSLIEKAGDEISVKNRSWTFEKIRDRINEILHSTPE